MNPILTANELNEIPVTRSGQMLCSLIWDAKDAEKPTTSVAVLGKVFLQYCQDVLSL